MMIDHIANAVSASILTRALFNVFLFLVLVAALIIAFVDLLQGRAIPDLVQNVLWGGILAGASILGVNFGLPLQPSSGPTQQQPAGGQAAGAGGTTQGS